MIYLVLHNCKNKNDDFNYKIILNKSQVILIIYFDSFTFGGILFSIFFVASSF